MTLQKKQKNFAIVLCAVVVCGGTFPAMVDAGSVNVEMSVTVSSVISMSLDNTNIDFGTITPGNPQTGTSIVTVDTNSENGYQLTAQQLNNGYTHTMRHGNAVDYIADKADFDGTAASTALWSGIGFGFTVYSATNRDTAIWGTGTTEADSFNRYAGFPASGVVINAVGYNIIGDVSHVGYKLNVNSAQQSGSYGGTVVYSAVVVP